MGTPKGGKPENAGSQGQQKVHRVNDANGNPVPDTGSGEGYMTQEQWRNRDKSAGLVRVDESTGEPLPETPDSGGTA